MSACSGGAQPCVVVQGTHTRSRLVLGAAAFWLADALMACASPAPSSSDAQSNYPDIVLKSTNLSQYGGCSGIAPKTSSCYSQIVATPFPYRTCAAAQTDLCKIHHGSQVTRGNCDKFHYFHDSASETEVIFLCDASDAIVGYQAFTFEQVDCHCLNQGELPFCVTSTTVPACD